MSDRLKKQAAIKRGANQAQKQTTQLDKQATGQLKSLWGELLSDILVVLSGASSVDGYLRSEILGRVKNTVSSLLDKSGKQQLILLENQLLASAQFGIQPFSNANFNGNSIAQFDIPNRTLAVVKAFIASDGLQLSDRIWGNIEEAKTLFNKRISAAVALGQSASEAALEMNKQGQPVPAELEKKAQGQKIAAVYKDVKNQFFDGPYKRAKLVLTTEINRAHGVAFEAAVAQHPEAIGTKFLLSHNHPRTDICDLHARVNRYGLGAGVYPIGKNPWPAHPGTISYTQVVFEDEVQQDDRKQQTDRISWLKKQLPSYQADVLGKKKALALRLGYLSENEINTPWAVLKKRYERRGLDLSDFE